MSTTVAYALNSATVPACRIAHPAGSHGKAATIGVIAGGRAHAPKHARAARTVAPQAAPPSALARVLQGAQGVEFGLSSRERAAAAVAGILFTLVAVLATML